MTGKPHASDIDLANAHWQRAPGEPPSAEAVEIARTGGFVAMRVSGQAGTPPLIFTRDEWHAFTAGVRDGEFDFGDGAP